MFFFCSRLLFSSKVVAFTGGWCNTNGNNDRVNGHFTTLYTNTEKSGCDCCDITNHKTSENLVEIFFLWRNGKCETLRMRVSVRQKNIQNQMIKAGKDFSLSFCDLPGLVCCV